MRTGEGNLFRFAIARKSAPSLEFWETPREA